MYFSSIFSLRVKLNSVHMALMFLEKAVVHLFRLIEDALREKSGNTPEPIEHWPGIYCSIMFRDGF